VGEYFAVSKLDSSTVDERPVSRSIDQDAVLTAYSRYASVYDLLFGLVFEPGRRAAVRAVNTQPDQRILEVGVGTGKMIFLTKPLRRLSSRYSSPLRG